MTQRRGHQPSPAPQGDGASLRPQHSCRSVLEQCGKEPPGKNMELRPPSPPGLDRDPITPRSARTLIPQRSQRFPSCGIPRASFQISFPKERQHTQRQQVQGWLLSVSPAHELRGSKGHRKLKSPAQPIPASSSPLSASPAPPRGCGGSICTGRQGLGCRDKGQKGDTPLGTAIVQAGCKPAQKPKLPHDGGAQGSWHCPTPCLFVCPLLDSGSVGRLQCQGKVHSAHFCPPASSWEWH